MLTEIESGVMHLQALEWQGLTITPEAETKEDFTQSLKNYERINCFLSHTQFVL